MKEKLKETPLEYMMSAVFGIEVTEEQLKKEWENSPEKRIKEEKKRWEEMVERMKKVIHKEEK